MNRPHLGAEQVAEIRRRHAAGYSITELAKAFGRSRLTISRIVKGESYKKVDADAVAEFAPLPTKRGGGAARIVERLRQQANPATVRHAPAPGPTVIIHLGSATDGPHCGAVTAGYINEYEAKAANLREMESRGVNVCPHCLRTAPRRETFPISAGLPASF